MNDDARVAEIIRYIWHVDYGCPPFISAPTYETDGIVLEWVQGRDSIIFFRWSAAYGAIVRSRYPSGTAFPRERFYIPGDFAQALLEANDNN